MRYDALENLPIHVQLNLPEAAKQTYRDAWNQAWETTADRNVARERAWTEVRERFERDPLTRSWIPKATPIALHAVANEEPQVQQIQAAAV